MLTKRLLPRNRQQQQSARWQRAFTLIELLVVLAIMATLLSIVGPRYFHSVDKAKEAALRSNLRIMRDAIDKFHADKGRYPETLKQLVDERYVRQVPVDPLLDRNDAWVLIPPPPSTEKSGVYDIHSGAQGTGSDGKPFTSW